MPRGEDGKVGKICQGCWGDEWNQGLAGGAGRVMPDQKKKKRVPSKEAILFFRDKEMKEGGGRRSGPFLGGVKVSSRKWTGGPPDLGRV